MSQYVVFPSEELDMRLAEVRARMAERDLDGLIVSVPENIYYLTALDHWGYFACHILVVPRSGEMVLVCRAMERITVENQVRNVRFLGHADDESPVDRVLVALSDLKLRAGRLGMEKRSLFLTPSIAEGIQDNSTGTHWEDASGLIDQLRLVKSPLEIAFTRKAAAAADAGMTAAIAAVREGASDYEIAAECHRAMILAGSEYPGFGPFIRPTKRIGEEHTTWRGDVFKNGDAIFLEIAAAYRKYQAPMGRLVYVGGAPNGADRSAQLAIDGMKAICGAISPGAPAGDAYEAWREIARSAGLHDYERHHCGYLVGIGFPPSWTGGSMVTSLAPNSQFELKAGMTFHLHSWFTNTDCVDYFVSNTALLTEDGCEILTTMTPETLTVC